MDEELKSVGISIFFIMYSKLIINIHESIPVNEFFKKLHCHLVMVYRPDMKQSFPLIVFLILIMAGCATVKIENKNVFPFRAGFKIRGTVSNSGIDLDGAMLVSSPESGVLQLYGPGGIAVNTLVMDDGTARLTDTWNREIGSYKVPVKNMAGLLAGLPPSGLRCTKKNEKGETEMKYLWGNIVLDEYLLPVRIIMKGNQHTNAVFSRMARGIDLMITRGSDNFIVNIYPIEGGRWKDAESEMQDVR